MKKDNYNDAIKRKLESIEPEFQEIDWEEMKAFMATPVPILPMSRFYKPIGYGLTGIALLTSLYFNARHYLESNDQAQNIMLNSKQQTTDPSFEKTLTPEIVYQIDTVFIDRIVTKIEKIYIKKPFDTANMVAQSTIIHKELDRDDANNLALKSESNLSDINSNESTMADNNRSSITKSSDANYSSNNEVNTSAKNDANVKKAAKNSSINNAQEILDIDTANTTYNFIGLKTLNLREFKFHNTFTFPPKFTGVKSHDYKLSKSHFAIRIPKINLENARYRFGISLDAGNEQLAAGFTNELILSKHWGVSAGLRLANLKGKDYLTAGEYETETKLAFRPTYASFVTAGNEILNIKFDDYFLQIPLSISYRYPLIKQWTLLFGLGTDLDIAGRQNVRFDYQGNSGEFDEGRSKANISNPVFNNGLLSAGIEKKFGKYVFQLMPYASAQWKTSIYKRDDILLGAKLYVMYQPRRF
jgi:hypothetical protein